MYDFVGADHWRKTNLFQLARWKNGLAFKNINFASEGRPVIKIAELKSGITDQTKFTSGNYDPDVLVEHGDMLFSWSGNPDTSIDVFRWDGPTGWLNQHIYKVYPASEVDEAFLFFLLRALRPRFAEIARNKQTTGLGHVTLGDFKQMAVGVPSSEEQRAIVSIVGPLQDKIDLNRRMNETLEAQAQALFRDWFVDFGPVKAKMAGAAPYLAPDLWSLFPDSLGDDDVPQGWEQSSLGSHTQNFDSKRVPLSKAERSKRPGEFPYHGATSVMDHVDDYLFDGIYTLIGEDGSVADDAGRAFTQYVFGKFWVNNHAHVLQGRNPVSTEQILLHFRHELVTPFITGAVQLKLSQGRMNSMPFIFAGAEICGKFNDVVAPLFAKIRANELESRTLARTRDLLLPKLMSGEIRIGDVERELESA